MDQAFQTELERSVARLDAYFLQNSRASADDLARFKTNHALDARLEASLCISEDAMHLRRALAGQGAEVMRASVDQLVARPGTPAWGDCP